MHWNIFRSRRTGKPAPRRRVRLFLESLENRTVPTTLVALSTNNALLTFDSGDPGTILNTAKVSGLQAGESLLGIDFRPADDLLYGLGSSGAIYTLDPLTGAATLKSTLAADSTDTTNAFTALSGSNFGIDFNPTVDRLRVVSDFGQNLRINVDTGAVTTDTPLAYVSGDPNAGRKTGVAGAAYTNNDTDTATATTLFVLDYGTDVIARQAPPNDGTLTTIGGLGFNTNQLVGFDINTDSTGDTAYAALTANGSSTGLFTIDVTTGAATSVGTIGGGVRIRDIAANTAEDSPAPLVVALSSANELLFFDRDDPGTIVSTVAVTGLGDGESLLGIDYRPATGLLYGLGSSGSLYTIDTTTGAATLASVLSVALDGTSFGVDFNPVPDRLRVVSNTGQNLRINVDTGAVTVDTSLSFSSLKSAVAASVSGVAYLNNSNPARGTTLFDIDFGRDVLARQSPPNDGKLTAVGSLGVDAGSQVGLDITNEGAINLAYASLVDGGVSSFYAIDLGTGSAILIGAIGSGTDIVDIAIGIPT